MSGAKPRNPLPTVDVIIELPVKGKGNGIVLIERKNPPNGWAIPGGFVDYGESLEEAAVREAREETSLEVELLCQMHAYSDPRRDPRFHTVTVVFVGRALEGGEPNAPIAPIAPIAKDDAKAVGVFTEDNLPTPIAFDHADVLRDYFRWKKEGWGVFDKG